MKPLSPWSVGAAVALTVLVTYTVCTVIFVTFPDSSVNFLNALFHGLAFRKLRQSGGGFSYAGFGGVAVTWVAVGFSVGALYAWFYNLFA
jgi:2TM family of unknown function (DUF5676)